VEFTVVATDSKGNPVTDLTKEDILISEKGHPREVAFFQFEGGDIPSRSQTLPTGEFTNRAEFSPGPARNITALVLDALNVGANGQAAVREDLMRYLNVLPRGTRAALYRLGKQVTYCTISRKTSSRCACASRPVSPNCPGSSPPPA
jgi:VWFA-related protein